MSETWSVVVGEPNDRGRPDGGGTQEIVTYQGDEDGAHTVYANAIRTATAMSYRYVLLRRGNDVVERWP